MLKQQGIFFLIFTLIDEIFILLEQACHVKIPNVVETKLNHNQTSV